MTRRGSLPLTLLAVVLALAGLTAGYVRWELAEPERFADRAVEALRSKEVRAAIAEQVAVAMVERGSPDLVASRRRPGAGALWGAHRSRAQRQAGRPCLEDLTADRETRAIPRRTERVFA